MTTVTGVYRSMSEIDDTTLPDYLHELKGWLIENDPEVWSEIGHLTIFEGAKVICDKYDLPTPHGMDEVGDGSKRILEGLQCKQKQN